MPAAGALTAALVSLGVSLGAHAHLAEPSPLTVALDVDTTRQPAPVTELRLLLPRGLDLASSELGLATCSVPAAFFTNVLLPGEPPDCDTNAKLGTGSATADIRLNGTADNDSTIAASGVITLFSGPPDHDRPGLLAYVVAQHPVRAQLVYAGHLYEAPRPFGVGLALAIPPIPKPPFDATVGLHALRLTIGGPNLTYRRTGERQGRAYHPSPIPLPATCPRHGFSFRAVLRFADGTRASTDARVPCPSHG